MFSLHGVGQFEFSVVEGFCNLDCILQESKSVFQRHQRNENQPEPSLVMAPSTATPSLVTLQENVIQTSCLIKGFEGGGEGVKQQEILGI